MNFQKEKVLYNKASAENTEKRLESQVKLQIIITKVYKIIHFTHTKISTPAIFVDPRQNFWTHVTHRIYAKVWITTPTNPRTKTTHASHAI